MNGEKESGYVDIRGISTYYEAVGEGWPMVFIHGWSLDLTCWRPQVEHFSKSHRTIAYDWRGTGRSGGQDSRYRLGELVEDLDVFLRKLGIERPILCGHSMGGDIILQYAATHPGSLSAAVIIDSPGIHCLLTSPLAYVFLRLGLAVTRLVFPSNPLAPVAPIFRYLFYTRWFQEAHPEAIAAWKKQFESNSVIAIQESFRALAFRKNLSKDLSKIAVPTILLVGAEDRIVSVHQATVYRDGIRGSRLDVLDGLGHMSFEEDPARVNRLVGDFLREQGLERPAGAQSA